MKGERTPEEKGSEETEIDEEELEQVQGGSGPTSSGNPFGFPGQIGGGGMPQPAGEVPKK